MWVQFLLYIVFGTMNFNDLSYSENNRLEIFWITQIMLANGRTSHSDHHLGEIQALSSGRDG